MLAGVMMFSALPMAYATNVYPNPTDETAMGTMVEYNAEADNDGDSQPDNVESYTVTVPAKLAPGGAGNVVAQGTWSSARTLVVTADEDVTLTNSINAADQKVLDVEFPGIVLAGSNTVSVTDTKEVSVADIENALFGTWEGVFEYQVEMVSPTVMFHDVDYVNYNVKPGAATKYIFYSDGSYTLEGGYFTPGAYLLSYNTIGQKVYDSGQCIGEFSADGYSFTTGDAGTTYVYTP